MALHSVSIKFKLAIIMGVLLVPIVLVSVWHYFEILEKETVEIATHNQNVAANLAGKLESLIHETFGVMNALSRHPAVIAGDLARSDRLFAELLPSYPYRINIIAVDMDGNNIGSAVAQPQSRTLNYRDSEWFFAAREGQDVVGNLHASKLFQQPSVMIAKPVYDDGARQVGVIGIPLDLQKLNVAMSSSWRKPARTAIMVVDRNGIILVDSRVAERVGKHAAAVLPQCIFPATRSETYVCVDSDGVERLVSRAPVEGAGWTVVTTVPVAGAKRFAMVVSSKSLMAAIGGGLAAFFLAVAIGRSITRGISELLSGMRELEQGNLDYTLKLAGNDELERVAGSFNAMAGRLRKSETDLRVINAELEERVARRTAQLELANREMESFSYSVSHDLCAPLRHLSGFSQALLEDHGGRLDEDARSLLDRIDRASKRMSDMIDAMLGLSRLTRGELSRETVDLGAMAREIAAELRKFQPERVVTFTIAGTASVYADPRLMRIVMENLLGNAWKYTRRSENAEIAFGTVHEEGKLVCFVRDNGVGFDMAFADRLFTPFQRMHRDEEFEGDGIGLATVQRIIHRHGGRVWYEAAVDRGATFFFSLD
ncbi:MAG: HAMP domain-containing protein [Desulfuromonadales bacterium]|nr:MAG: HAMP domain-containing protein [Desulfuromonadales bacterium]